MFPHKHMQNNPLKLTLNEDVYIYDFSEGENDCALVQGEPCCLPQLRYGQDDPNNKWKEIWWDLDFGTKIQKQNTVECPDQNYGRAIAVLILSCVNALAFTSQSVLQVRDLPT